MKTLVRRYLRPKPIQRNFEYIAGEVTGNTFLSFEIYIVLGIYDIVN